MEVEHINVSGVTGHINAGGRGTRLRSALPESMNDPVLGVTKALLMVGQDRKPLINWHIDKLLHQGFDSIVASVGDHQHLRYHIKTSYLQHPEVHAVGTMNQLGTGGDLLMALRNYPDAYKDLVLVNNVDTITGNK